MTDHDPPKDNDAPRSSETVAVLDFATPSGLTRAVAHASGLNRALNPAVASPHRRTRPRPASTFASIPTPRRVILRAVFFAALLASLTWGILEVRKHSAVERQGPRAGQDGPVAPPPSAVATSVDRMDPADDLDLEDASYPGVRALALLRTHVKRDGEVDGPAVELASSGAIAPQAITVVNFWATWCAPCKAEFSGFQSMFVLNRRNRAWGAETRFVPILVDDEENARTAYRNWQLSMPDVHAALIDQKLDQSGVYGALQQLKLLTPSSERPLPVTLLFDCRRRIRWSKIGALDVAAFETLTAEIEKLRAELGQDKCKPRRTPTRTSEPKPAPASAVAPTTPCNDNNRCEPEFAEDCHLCPAECRCKSGERCNPRRTPAVCKEVI